MNLISWQRVGEEVILFVRHELHKSIRIKYRGNSFGWVEYPSSNTVSTDTDQSLCILWRQIAWGMYDHLETDTLMETPR